MNNPKQENIKRYGSHNINPKNVSSAYHLSITADFGKQNTTVNTNTQKKQCKKSRKQSMDYDFFNKQRAKDDNTLGVNFFE